MPKIPAALVVIVSEGQDAQASLSASPHFDETIVVTGPDAALIESMQDQVDTILIRPADRLDLAAAMALNRTAMVWSVMLRAGEQLTPEFLAICTSGLEQANAFGLGQLQVATPQGMQFRIVNKTNPGGPTASFPVDVPFCLEADDTADLRQKLLAALEAGS